MSRLYESVTKTETRDELKELRCDLCGTLAKDGCWEKSMYEVNEVDISMICHHREGDSYPSGDGSGDDCTVDLCPTCFRTKLVPWLQSQGAKIWYKDYSL